MAAWTTIDTNALLPGEPWTSAKANAVYENPQAIAEGASGAPEVEVAWHLLEVLTSTVDTNGELTLTTDLTPYRAIRVVGGFNFDATGAVFQTQVGGSWLTVAETTNLASGNGDALMFSINITNTDAGDTGMGFKVATLNYCEYVSAANWQTTGVKGVPLSSMGLVNSTSPVTGFRVNMTGGIADFLGSTGAPSKLTLYGIKRTAA